MWLAQGLRPRWSVAPARASRLWNWTFSHRYPAPPHTPRHTVETNLDALRRVGIYPEDREKALVMVPGAQAEKRVEELLASLGIARGAFIQVHPGSRWLFKAWTEPKYAELMRALARDGHPIVVTGAPDTRERAIVARILAQAGEGVRDLSGQLTLREMAALSARARLFFGVGPSSEATWGPWRVPSRVVTSNHPCRPCGLDGCGGGKVSECITELPVERVRSAVNELLAQR
jgi:heptosyltransferase-3